MSSPIITIGIVSYNSADFILNTLKCLEKITKNDYKVIIRDNNSKLKDYLYLEKKIQQYSNVELYRIENFNHPASMAHGIGVNDLVSKMDSKFGVILDADCTFLYKNWDEILINEINEKYPIIGTEGIDHPDSTRQIDFPMLFALFFNTKILKQLKIDFRPKFHGEFRDTGYVLAEKFLKEGYKGKLISLKATRYFKDGPFCKVICGEYYLEGHKEVFVSHFGRGSTLGKSKYLRGFKKKFYVIPIIGSYLLELKGIREKKRWIKICRKIVNVYNKK